MRDDSKLIPQVFMKGSFREMGSQYGEAMASEIAFQKDWWTKVLAAHWPNMDMERALNAAKTMYAPAVELYAPRWADFIEGMAEGAFPMMTCSGLTLPPTCSRARQWP